MRSFTTIPLTAYKEEGKREKGEGVNLEKQKRKSDG
jgi:hypothetical protein